MILGLHHSALVVFKFFYAITNCIRTSAHIVFTVQHYIGPRYPDFLPHIFFPKGFFLGWQVFSGLRLKPWPNGVASYHKLKTCGNLRLRLAMTCVYLRRLAMTCFHFDRAQICTQVNASFSPFGHPKQVVASWSQYCFPLYGRACKAALKWLFLILVFNLRLLASPFGHPSQVCIRKFTFPNLRWLATPFGQGLTTVFLSMWVAAQPWFVISVVLLYGFWRNLYCTFALLHSHYCKCVWKCRWCSAEMHQNKPIGTYNVCCVVELKFKLCTRPHENR